jgi:hypothetical protein
MKTLTNMAFALFALLVVSPAGAEWQVWTETRTVRVLRDAEADDNLAVELCAAGNEWESFQILLRSTGSVSGINIEAGDLRGPKGCILRGADARLFRQHQLEMNVGTYRNDAFQPGWYADPLIPFRRAPTGEVAKSARFVAVPFDLPVGQTHGFWVDIYVPADTAPGEYSGTYRVTSQNGSPVQVPVSVTVWDFDLPRVSTLQTALGSPAQRMRGYYRQRAAAGKEEEPTDWDAVETQCAELLTRHRINATPPAGSLTPIAQPDGTYRIPGEQVRALRAFVDRYHVNAVSVPRPTTIVKDPDNEREKLHAWLKSWDQAAAELDRPHVTFYTYLRDEPNDEEAYRFVQKWGRAIRQAESCVKVLVVEQTWSQKEAWGDLYGAIDIWCPLFSLFRPESAARRQAAGETIWTYTALCQGKPTPWWHIDFPLLHYRAPSWIAWRYRIRGILYWGGMSYWRGVEDPWTDPKTLDRRAGRKDPLFNGEGTLVYPGRAVGYEGIAPSLRLKALRDGIEDYEYLAILERAGLADAAEQMVMPLAGSWFEWEKDAGAYEAARVKLADLIVRHTTHIKP